MNIQGEGGGGTSQRLQAEQEGLVDVWELILLWKEQKMNSILFCESSIMSKWRAAARPATP